MSRKKVTSDEEIVKLLYTSDSEGENFGLDSDDNDEEYTPIRIENSDSDDSDGEESLNDESDILSANSELTQG